MCFISFKYTFFPYWMSSIFKLYFIGYAITVVLILPLCPPPPSPPHSLRQSPHHCSCPWVMCISSLATAFPILYFTSPWLFCNYLCVLLNHLTSHPFSPSPLPSSNHLVTNFFSLSAFKSLSLSLIFGLLIMVCLRVALFASIIIGTLWVFPGLACVLPLPN